MKEHTKVVMEWVVKLWPVWMSVVAVVGFAYQTNSRLGAAETRFDRIEVAIADMQRTVAANAVTVAELSSLVGRDARDIQDLRNAAEVNRAGISEIKGDIKEIKAILQQREKSR